MISSLHMGWHFDRVFMWHCVKVTKFIYVYDAYYRKAGTWQCGSCPSRDIKAFLSFLSLLFGVSWEQEDAILREQLGPSIKAHQ